MTDQTGGETDQDPALAAGTPLTPEEALRRKARKLASDDGDAAHMGGVGAQGGQVDFGLPKNFS